MTSEPDSQEAGLPGLPEAPVDRLVGPIARFLHVEAASGVVLLAATLAALCLANSPLGPGFLALLPEGVDWSALVGGGLLAGIGFTMALFIAGLALEGPLLDARSRAPCSTPARGPPARRPLEGPLLDAAKVGILGASAACGAAGMLLLRSRLPAPGADAPR